jgi:aminoglycoside 2'-N-acetyltransferase I
VLSPARQYHRGSSVGIPANMRIVSFAEPDVPAGLSTQVLALRNQAWPGDEPSELRPWHDPAWRPLSMLLIDDGRVVSALDILSKDITHRDRRFAASGLSTVVTDEARRGSGYGRQLVIAAREVISARGADLGIFTCDRPLRAFYEGAGWEVLPGTVLVGGTPEAPFPSDQFGFDKVTMASFFSTRARRHAGTFIDCRIELYPGKIDKLW